MNALIQSHDISNLRNQLVMGLAGISLLTVALTVTAFQGNGFLTTALLLAFVTLVTGLWLYLDKQTLAPLHKQHLSNLALIDKTTQELGVTRLKLEQANLLESEFLSNMGHELRTPLSAVIGISEMLLEDAEDQSESEMVRSMSRISIAGRRLLRLLNELLDLASIESGKMRLSAESIEITSLLDDVVSAFSTIAIKNGNTFKVEIESGADSIFTDAQRLKQILSHLLNNALRFTQNGLIQIQVSCQADAEGDQMVAFMISDTGKGMSQADAQRINVELSQSADSAIPKNTALGLGLSVCHRLGILMSGKLKVNSDEDHGSRFTLLLPRKATTSDTSIWLNKP